MQLPSLIHEAWAQGDFNTGFTIVDGIRETAGLKDYGRNLLQFILDALGIVGSLIAVVALAALLYGAFMYITSLGDETKTEKAKQIILYAIVGLIILGAAGIAVNVAINFIKK